MKLKKILIKNLRGLQNIQFDVDSLTSLIGKNNCGKSSILRAIELVCSGSKPDLEEFYLRDYNGKVEIEAVFEDITEWERTNQSISALIYNNKLHLRYTACVNLEGEKQKCDVVYYAYKVDELIQGWADKWSSLDETIKVIALEIGIKSTNFNSASGREKVKQQIRDNYPHLIQSGEPQWSNESIPFNNALQQAIPKVILIPAVKDATEESKFSKTGKSAFGELMKKLILPAIQIEEEYLNILNAISSFSDKIHSKDGIEGIKLINNKLSDRLSRLINAKANVRFSDPEIDTLISSSVGLRILDGNHDTPISLQGHGLQRSLIFSLLELVAENDAVIQDDAMRSTIVLYEEPELYLHPQMLRKLKSILNIISNSDKWQVVCTTHSPVFINVVDHPESLVILSKSSDGQIVVRQLLEDPFEKSESGIIERDALRAALDFHPTVCEVFFSDNVVLVEGDSEMAILKHCDKLLEYCGIDVNRALDCSIVSCGGKWTIPAIARLLNKFDIKYKIVHDLDKKGKSDEQIKELPSIHPYHANKRIAMVCDYKKIFINEDTLEDIWGGSKSDKPYSALKCVLQLVEEDEVPHKLESLVKFVYSDCLEA